MKKTLSSLTVAVIAAFAAQGAMAQAASSPTRAEVKKETAAANKAGQIPGTGAELPAHATGTQSPKQRRLPRPPRATIARQTTAEANKAGAIPGHGRVATPAAAAGSSRRRQKAATSTTTRDDRKAATAEANKAGTIPQAEAQMQAPKK